MTGITAVRKLSIRPQLHVVRHMYPLDSMISPLIYTQAPFIIREFSLYSVFSQESFFQSL